MTDGGQWRFLVRSVLVFIILASTGVLGSTVLSSQSDPVSNTVKGDPNFETLVITSHGSEYKSRIVAYGPSGDVVYQNSSFSRYFDVDPVQGTTHTVEYVAARYITDGKCSDQTCTRNMIIRTNLSTGDTTILYSHVTPKIRDTRWHDADRLSETEYVVADIFTDSVYVVNLTTQEVT